MYTAESYFMAPSAEEALRVLNADPANAVIGGSLWMRLGSAAYHTLIDLSRAGLDTIAEETGFVRIGGCVSLRALETDPVLTSRWGNVLGETVAPIVGTQFRSMATVGGTLAGRFPFSDLITALVALDAEVELCGAGRMSLSDYLAGPALRDIVVALYIPDDGRVAVTRSQRPTATDFSVVVLTLCGCPDGSFRLSVGNRPARAERCTFAETALAAGNVEAAKTAVSDMSYGDNLRGSAEYRRAMAAVLTGRAYDAWKELTDK